MGLQSYDSDSNSKTRVDAFEATHVLNKYSSEQYHLSAVSSENTLELLGSRGQNEEHHFDTVQSEKHTRTVSTVTFT